jgi:hypothetical protein
VFYILILPAIMEEAFFVPCTIACMILCAPGTLKHEHGDDGDFVFPEDMDFEEVELLSGAGDGAGDFFHHPEFTFDD